MLGNDFLSDYKIIFEGALRESLRCLKCERCNDTQQYFTDVALPITGDLFKCLAQMAVPEPTPGVHCHECDAATDACLSSSI